MKTKTPTLKQIVGFTQDAELDAIAQYRGLLNFTQIYVEHARDLARSGKKDSARNWYRYFDNSRILKILASHNVTCEKLSKLRGDLEQLKGECHPQDVPSWETDIQYIRSALEKIAANLPRKRETTIAAVVKSRPAVSLVSISQRGRSRKTLVQKYA
jgi:hypothetical protein